MKFFRHQRVESLIQEKLSWMIEREVEVPGALVTITGVEISKKMENAEVKVSVFPSDKKDAAMKILDGLAGHFQYELLRLLNIKPLPRIQFIYDVGPEKAALIEKALLKDNKEL